MSEQSLNYQPKTPQEELIRAGHANEILNSALFVEMREHVESMLKAQRRAVPLTETEMHTRLIITEQLWGNLVEWFEQIVQTGELAAKQIQQSRSLKERMFGGRR